MTAVAVPRTSPLISFSLTVISPVTVFGPLKLNVSPVTLPTIGPETLTKLVSPFICMDRTALYQTMDIDGCALRG